MRQSSEDFLFFFFVVVQEQQQLEKSLMPVFLRIEKKKKENTKAR